jgi:hypothetical protein
LAEEPEADGIEVVVAEPADLEQIFQLLVEYLYQHKLIQLQ